MSEPDYVSTWEDAEHLAQGWLNRWGYRDARVTNGGSDGGVDVRGSMVLAQVKFEARQVGRPMLQQLVGARGNGNQELFFFTGTGFSTAAIEYANYMDIHLFAFDIRGDVTSYSDIATKLVRTPEVPLVPGEEPPSPPKVVDREFVEGRRATGGVVAFFGLLVCISSGYHIYRAVSGNPTAQWDWWDPFWVIPLGVFFIWVGKKIAGPLDDLN